MVNKASALSGERANMAKRTKRRQLGIAALVATACGLTAGAIPNPALAAFVFPPPTLDTGNTGSGFGTGNFGTVHLGLNTTVTVDLADNFFIIDTGFPGSFGFADALGGGLTIGNFSSAAYSGLISDATSDQHFDGFGYVNDAGATTGPSAGSGSAQNMVSFDVSKGTSIPDVNQMVNLANPQRGHG